MWKVESEFIVADEFAAADWHVVVAKLERNSNRSIDFGRTESQQQQRYDIVHHWPAIVHQRHVGLFRFRS